MHHFFSPAILDSYNLMPVQKLGSSKARSTENATKLILVLQILSVSGGKPNILSFLRPIDVLYRAEKS